MGFLISRSSLYWNITSDIDIPCSHLTETSLQTLTYPAVILLKHNFRHWHTLQSSYWNITSDIDIPCSHLTGTSLQTLTYPEVILLEHYFRHWHTLKSSYWNYIFAVKSLLNMIWLTVKKKYPIQENFKTPGFLFGTTFKDCVKANCLVYWCALLVVFK